MSHLLLAKLQTAADVTSAEAGFQLGVLRAEATRVWDQVSLVEVETVAELGPHLDGIAGSDVLLVGPGCMLLGRRSLAAMASRRAAGALAVVPVPLAAIVRPDQPPPYTLRAFEQIEDHFLATAREETDEAPLLPVSLLAGELAAAAGATAASGRPLAPVRAVRAGLYHAFADYYGQARVDVLPFLPPAAREVLEIGCGRGATGRLLQERLGCRVTGVELNPAAAAAAAEHLHAVHCGDVATLSLTGTFDVVLALELFEHLPAGEEVLTRLAALLRPGGLLLLSVPNVGHYSVVSDLLAGRWDYLPIGLLCYTHYRFFTRRTLEDWLRRIGLHRFTLVPQHTEPPPISFAAPGLAVDDESLRTKGFYVLIEP